MQRLTRKVVIFLVSAAFCASAACARAQAGLEGTLSRPDSHKIGPGSHGHLFGDWGGERIRLLQSDSAGLRFSEPMPLRIHNAMSLDFE